MVLLREGARETEVLLIERTRREDDPASGQIAFPGGHVEPGDGSLAETALREMGEEVGLTRADLRLAPRFVGITYASRFRLDIGVFASELGPGRPRARPKSRAEVAHVFWLPSSALERTEYVARDTPLGSRTVPAVVRDGRVLWGFTRRVLREFFGLPPDAEIGGPPPAGPDGASRNSPEHATDERDSAPSSVSETLRPAESGGGRLG